LEVFPVLSSHGATAASFSANNNELVTGKATTSRSPLSSVVRRSLGRASAWFRLRGRERERETPVPVGRIAGKPRSRLRVSRRGTDASALGTGAE
jgi:hypothetical protein